MKKSGVLLVFVATVSLFAAQAAAQLMCLPSNWCWENPLPQGNNLNGIWNVGQHAYMVGSGGTILHYDGNVWTMMDSPTTANQFAIWGAGSDDVFATGSLWTYTGGFTGYVYLASTTMYHYDGVSWSEWSETPHEINLCYGHGGSKSKLSAQNLSPPCGVNTVGTRLDSMVADLASI